jgi:Co/Zn/Cd efflux system component
MMIVEIVGGSLFGSLALVADGLRMAISPDLPVQSSWP